MKNFTKNLMLVAATATALSAGAEATWQPFETPSTFFLRGQSGRGIMADFDNNGHIDIFYSVCGNSNAIYNHRGLWGWQSQSNLYYNNGDGTFAPDIISSEGTGEFEDVYDGDGNLTGQEEKYRYVDPKHGIAPILYPHYVTFDYNNDGLVDLLISGIAGPNDDAGYYNSIPEDRRVEVESGQYAVTVLYKNLGNGKFELVPEFNIPPFIPDDNNGKSNFMNTMSFGDYDHDGYADLALSGIYKNSEPGEPNRVAQLWRNIDGTGRFEQQNIAETRGGSWTDAVSEGEGDEKEEILPSRELEGWFLLISGNVTMADINNDGWLDLVFDGWANKVSDGVYEAGSNGRVYLNQPDEKGGRKFVDITDPTGMFYLCRSGNTRLVDFNGDGYLDLINAGYGDHNLGFKTLLFNNNLGDDPTADPETVFNYGESMGQYGLTENWCEKFNFVIRDFDADGVYDVFYAGREDGAIFYGNMAGNYDRSNLFPVRGYDCQDGFEWFGDLTGNGLVDRMQAGYSWTADNHDGVNYRETLGCNEWAHGGYLWYNRTDMEVEAPEAPGNIRTSFDRNANTITVEWDDIDDIYSAYNVVMLTPSGKVVSNIPVDPVTGFVKVAEKKEIAVRPMVNKYTLPATEPGEYKLGVQAVSLMNEKASPIAWGAALSSVGSISADLNNTTVKVTVNGNTIVANADANAEVKVVDMMGRTIATGVTNTPIAVDAKGVLIVTAAGQSVKVVK